MIAASQLISSGHRRLAPRIRPLCAAQWSKPQPGKRPLPAGIKHIPATGVEEPATEVSHATLFPTAATIDEAWFGKGQIGWHHLTWEQNPTQHHIVNALADLPIVEHRFSLISKGTTNLVVPSARCRALG